jgi:hypothetical protein
MAAALYVASHDPVVMQMSFRQSGWADATCTDGSGFDHQPFEEEFRTRVTSPMY